MSHDTQSKWVHEVEWLTLYSCDSYLYKSARDELWEANSEKILGLFVPIVTEIVEKADVFFDEDADEEGLLIFIQIP